MENRLIARSQEGRVVLQGCIVLSRTPPTYLATPLPTNSLVWSPPPFTYTLISVPPPTTNEELEMARRREQTAAKRRYCETKAANALQKATDQAAAAAYAAREWAKTVPLEKYACFLVQRLEFLGRWHRCLKSCAGWRGVCVRVL